MLYGNCIETSAGIRVEASKTADRLRTRMAPEAAIFDMDGLLVESERCSFNAWREASLARGYHMTEEIFAEVVGKTVADSHRSFREAFGEEFPAEELRNVRNEIFNEEIVRNGLPSRPGAPEVLTFLNDISFPWAIATTTKREAALLRLRCAGLGDLIGHMVCGDEVAHSKPAPDLYLEAARKLGVPADRCIAVEDSDIGAEAAWNAGMEVIIIPDMKKPSAEPVSRALCVLRDLHVFREIFERSWLDRERTCVSI